MASTLSKFRDAPGLLVNIDCEVFTPVRRNPNGTFKLDPEQEKAIEKLTKLLIERQGPKRTVLVLAGYAGTGKTTVMKELMTRLEAAGQRVKLAAPTGKASARLAEATKREAGTIHSMIYTAPTQFGQCPACGESSEPLGQSMASLKQAGLKGWKCPKCGVEIPLSQGKSIKKTLGFTTKGQSPPGVVEQPTVVIVDEASMVDVELARDLEKFLPPAYAVLYVGDKGQLPPVGGVWGADFDHPTAELTKVHRQAGDNPILNLATRLREGKNTNQPFALDPDVDPGNRLVVKQTVLAQAAEWLAKKREERANATLLAYTNRVRIDLNQMVRRKRGLEKLSRELDQALVHADRVLILANNREANLTNGEVLIVEEAWYPKGKLAEAGFLWVKLYKRGTFLVAQNLMGIPYDEWRDEVGRYVWEYMWAERTVQKGHDPYLSLRDKHKAEDILEMDTEERFDRYKAIAPGEIIHVDYGECITVHKSQGSQWTYVGLIWDYSTKELFKNGTEKDPLEGERWLYTAVTRASEQLTVFNLLSPQAKW